MRVSAVFIALVLAGAAYAAPVEVDWEEKDSTFEDDSPSPFNPEFRDNELPPLEDDDELVDEDSTILDCANKGQLARVEITLRGQLIRDKCDLMIDARPPDIDVDDPCGDRAGQARPGGDWVSVFRVGPDARPDDDKYDQPKSEQVGSDYSSEPDDYSEDAKPEPGPKGD